MTRRDWDVGCAMVLTLLAFAVALPAILVVLSILFR